MHQIDGNNDLQCPACGWRGVLEDFDIVKLMGVAQVHCPSCDANLGTREHAVENAA